MDLDYSPAADGVDPVDAAEAAEAAAAAAREEQQLSADAAAQGGVVLPPEGHKALSNQHLTWKNRMRVTAYMTPDNVEDKVAGVRELLDDSLFRYVLVAGAGSRWLGGDSLSVCSGAGQQKVRAAA
jgi:hypothetical protein